MASINDQAQFLAQGPSHSIYIDNDDKNVTMQLDKEKCRRRRCIKCCGCCTAAVLILAVIMLVLGFTILRVHEPSIRLNTVNIDGLSHLTSISTFQPNVNLTVSADVSVKNPNAASFKFDQARTRLFYDERVVGEALTPPGTAKARRTVRMNVTMEVMVEKILNIPRLGNDLMSGELHVSTYTIINGRINILKIIKKNAEIIMNCSMTVDLRSQGVRDIDCEKKVSL